MSETPVIEYCNNILPGHGPRKSVRDTLSDLVDHLSGEEQADHYGKGEYLEQFESRLAAMFGKAAGVFMPSGTMAQQIALRVWCEQKNNFTVAMHPTSHLETAEQLGYQFLHGMHRLQFGVPEMLGHRTLRAEDLKALPQTPGATLIELPYRPLGGELPSWETLVEIRRWAQSNQVPLHLDGARIWQCRPFYQKSLEEIGALFDSVYVSFYKDLGALAGCMLMGPEPFIQICRMWQRRYGGNLYSQAANVVSAQLQLDRVLPAIDGWVDRAREIASAFAAIDGVRVYPDPPHTNMFRLFIEGDAERLMARHTALARETGTFLFHQLSPSVVPGIAWTEVHVWENAMTFDLAGLTAVMKALR